MATEHNAKYDYIIKHDPKNLDGRKPLDPSVVQDSIISNQEILYGATSQTRINFLWDTPMQIDAAWKGAPGLTGGAGGINQLGEWKIPVSFGADGRLMPLYCKVAVTMSVTGGANQFDLVLKIHDINGVNMSVFLSRPTNFNRAPANERGSAGFIVIKDSTPAEFTPIVNYVGGVCLWTPNRGVTPFYTRRDFSSTVLQDVSELGWATLVLYYVSNEGTVAAEINSINVHGLYVRECALYDYAEV